jgi:hypothetical protein
MTPKEAIALARLLVSHAASANGPVDDTTWTALLRAGKCAKAHAIAPGLVEVSIPSPNEERSWPKVEHSALAILQAFHASRFEVKLLKPDDPSDFRICEIKEGGTERLVFTGRVLKSQATRPKVERDIARWCELNPNKLPKDGGTVLIDLASISI